MRISNGSSISAERPRGRPPGSAKADPYRVQQLFIGLAATPRIGVKLAAFVRLVMDCNKGPASGGEREFRRPYDRCRLFLERPPYYNRDRHLKAKRDTRARATRLVAEGKTTRQEYQRIIRHFLTVNECDMMIFKQREHEAIATRLCRSSMKWTVDFGLLARARTPGEPRRAEAGEGSGRPTNRISGRPTRLDRPCLLVAMRSLHTPGRTRC
jgi:hypothetical protein